MFRVNFALSMESYANVNMQNRDQARRESDGLAKTCKADSLAGQSAELVRVLDHYLNELEAGRQPDRARLLADHPDLAAQLEPALAGLDLIHDARGGARPVPERLGDFRIIREVGRGGMGVVYEAEQISLKRRVALKVLRYAWLPDPEALSRFQREAETVGALHHTNIVPIFAIGKEGKMPYYAMQFIEGSSLAEKVQWDHPVDPMTVAAWGLQAADALAHAHQRGVIHRDIKPSNLILDPDGRIWLTDFGLAKRTDDLTLSLTGALLGTPRYMSPEQASSLTRPVDHRTDIYSLGATLYELATGRLLFEAEGPDLIIHQILTSEPVPPRRLAPSLPRDLETIILKCLEKNSAARYTSAQELAEDLRAFRDGRPIRARRASWPERTVRWVRKHRRTSLVAGISAAVAMFLMAAGLGGWHWHQARTRASLSLTTSGPNLLADLLDDEGRPVAPSFPVPTPEPMALPEGNYRLRLSASGLLSEDWPIELARGGAHTYPVLLRERWLWPPMELNARQYPEIDIAQLEGRDDLIMVLHDMDGIDGEAGRRIRRVNGATGRPVWEKDLAFTVSTLPPGSDQHEWLSFLAHSGLLHRDSRLLEVQPDLDDDGVGDLVFISRQSPSLLAVSGTSGKVVWWHRALTPLPDDPLPDETQFVRRGGGTVVGSSVWSDVDGDGVLDFLVPWQVEHAVYRESDGRERTLLRSGWLGAVSGRSGKALWQFSLGDVWAFYRNSSDATIQHEALTRPRLVRENGKLRVMLVVGGRVLSIDAATGQPARPALPLGFDPVQAPVLVGSQGEETLLLLRIEQGERNQLALTGHRLNEAEPRWKKVFRAATNRQITDHPLDRCYQVEDLGGTAGQVIVLPVTTAHSLSEKISLQILSVHDGSTLWQCDLPKADSAPPRILSGPDIDRDGVRELFAVYAGVDLKTQTPRFYVRACSGKDGRAVWDAAYPHSGTHSIPDPSGDLLWWQNGSDGWPLLAIPVHNGHGRQPVTYFVSARSGRAEHLLPDVAALRPGDFNGDGLLDLFYVVSPQNSPRGLILRGEPAVPWARLGNWHPGQDFDRDGYVDMLAADGTVRSGADGGELYRIPAELDKLDRFLSLPAPAGDLDGDLIPDLVVFQKGIRKESGHSVYYSRESVRAYSGRTGKSLWEDGGFELGPGGGGSSGVQWSSEYPALDWVDLDGDNAIEILALHSVEDRGIELTGLDGRTGKRRWSIPAAPGTIGSDPSPFPIPWMDLTGDAVKDPAVWAPLDPKDAWNSPCRLQAFDGRSGALLWTAQDLKPTDRNHLGWPRPQVADLDGDGFAEVIVVLHDGYHDRGNARGYRPRLVTVDGRSGVMKWIWSWETGWPDLLPPLIVRGPENRLAVALAIQEETGPALVLLSGEGNQLRRDRLQCRSGDLRASRSLWAAADLDGDGMEELLIGEGDHLRTYSVATDETLWRIPLPGGDSKLIGLSESLGGQDSFLSLWSGTTVQGMNGRTGRPVWRSVVPMSPVWGSSSPPVVRVLQAGGAGSLPRVWFNYAHGRDLDWMTQCRESWPVDEAGRYLAGYLDTGRH